MVLINREDQGHHSNPLSFNKLKKDFEKVSLIEIVSFPILILLRSMESI